MEHKRKEFLDVISGLMILWMIIYHAFQWGHRTESFFFSYLLKIFHFFIPWFYFKSGMFFRKMISLKALMLKGAGQLIIPMVIWTMLGYVLTIPELLVKDIPIWKIFVLPIYTLLNSGDALGNSPLWFLFSLFLVKIGLQFVTSFNIRLKILLLFSLGIFGWYLQWLNIKLPLGLHSFPLGLFFAVVGCLFSEYAMRISSFKREFGVLFFYLFLLLNYSSYVDVHDNKVWYGEYWLYILNSLFGLTIAMHLFKFIKSGFLSWVGLKSMIFLVLHWPIFYLIKMGFVLWGYSSNTYHYVFALVGSAIFVSSFAAKFIPEKYLMLKINVVTEINFNKVKGQGVMAKDNNV